MSSAWKFGPNSNQLSVLAPSLFQELTGAWPLYLNNKSSELASPFHFVKLDLSHNQLTEENKKQLRDALPTFQIRF